MSHWSEAFSKAVIGFSGMVDAISKLEEELELTKALVNSMSARIRTLEESDGVDVELIDKILDNYDLEAKIETIVDDRIDSALDMRLDDAIESALSGREIEVTLSGSVTL